MSYTNGLDKPSDYFNTKLYTGNGSTGHAISSVGFQPDWTWIKYRNSATYGHDLYDAVRGATKTINTNNTSAEYTSADRLTAFNSDGFTLGSGAPTNDNSGNFVSWNWKANGTGSANTDGTITSTVSANQIAGFSIVTYSGNSTAGATVGHALNATPKMIIMKNLQLTTQWQIYHESIGNTHHLQFDTSAKLDDAGAFNDTSPTSSVFSLGASNYGNGNGNNMIAYCFAEKKGYSKFGSYVGNGSTNGSYIHTGFSPSFVMSKRTDSADGWRIMDTTRSPFNVAQHRLLANASDAEVVASSQDKDFLSNGFKIRNSDSGYNASGGTYIYMAFAKNPFVTSTGIPTTAR